MKLKGQYLHPGKITPKEECEMFGLMSKYFGNVSLDQFREDLYEKDYIILLKSIDNGKVAGFSTQKVFYSLLGKEKVTVVYSGDTIIDRRYWGTRVLPDVFWQLTREIKKAQEDYRIFWMLISKGVRTYRFLPVFYRVFYPNYKSNTPTVYKEFMDRIGYEIFPHRYNPHTGIIVSSGEHQYLKEAFHPPRNRNSNPHEVFFYENNPGFIKGDELLCITELELDNIHPHLQKHFSML